MVTVFLPYFTTKPTDQACPPLFIRWRTGLGLSLSYDIVKAYGGKIKVEIPNEGGTIFHILLPINQ